MIVHPDMRQMRSHHFKRLAAAQLEKWLVDRKSTRLNSSHLVISYAVLCLKKIEALRDHKFRNQFCAFRLTIGNDGWGRAQHPFDTLKKLTDRNLFGEELRRELNDTVTRQL